MPLYLVHGFRWPRRAIRIHIILENIDEAAAEYLIAPESHDALLHNFHEKFPDEMKLLPKLRFIEQHDPNGDSIVSQPYAFVVDKVKSFDLSFNVREGLENAEFGLEKKQKDAMEELKGKLGLTDEEVGWWVVYNGDEERLDGVDARGSNGNGAARPQQLKSKKSFKKLFGLGS